MIPSDAAPPLAPSHFGDIVYPGALTPVIQPHRIANPSAPIATFESDGWPLEALETDSSRTSTPLRFDVWPEGFQDFAKHVAFTLINHGNPPSLVERTGSSYAQWPATESLKLVLQYLKTLVEWLTQEDGDAVPWGELTVHTPADLDSDHLDHLRRWIESSADSPYTKNKKLEAIVRVWHLAPWLPESVRWPEPAWHTSKWRLARRDEENRTARIPQAVMGPLLEWAIAFVTLFADDIFEADTHYLQRRAEQQTRAKESATEVLDRYVREDRTLPADPLYPGRIGWQAVAFHNARPVDGLAETYFRRYRGRLLISSELGELGATPSARFHGVQWLPTFHLHDFTPQLGLGVDYGVLLAHLRTACLVVCAYLTGARPEEVLSFSHGAAREPTLQPDGSLLQLIDGLSWKGARRGEDGSPVEPIRAVWATIPVAATAVRVAERVSRRMGRDSGPLFSSGEFRTNPGAAREQIENFAAFVNERLVPHSHDPEALGIPEWEGYLHLSRFRRTLAWFITNRPNGEITTAIQYQHVSDRLVAGYAGTKDGGMRDLLLEEDWQHRRRTIAHIAELLESGGHLTGPAAARATTVALGMPRFLTPADEKRLRKDKTLVIYDNPSAISICVWDEDHAACRKMARADGRAGPNLPGCIDGCLNCARTPGQVDQLEADARRLRRSADNSPKPIAQSLVARAERNERIVDEARLQEGRER